MNPLTVVKAKIIKDFMIRNGYNAQEHVSAAWLRFLQIKTGLIGYMYDLEKIWLRSLGGVGDTLHDIWVDFLLQEGYAGDKLGMKRFFEAWTEASGDSFLLIEAGDYLLLESSDKVLLEA